MTYSIKYIIKTGWESVENLTFSIEIQSVLYDDIILMLGKFPFDYSLLIPKSKYRKAFKIFYI